MNPRKLLTLFIPTGYFLMILLCLLIKTGFIWYQGLYLIIPFMMTLALNLKIQKVFISRIAGALMMFISIGLLLAIWEEMDPARPNNLPLTAIVLLTISVVMSSLLIVGHKAANKMATTRNLL